MKPLKIGEMQPKYIMHQEKGSEIESHAGKCWIHWLVYLSSIKDVKPFLLSDFPKDFYFLKDLKDVTLTAIKLWSALSTDFHVFLDEKQIRREDND